MAHRQMGLGVPECPSEVSVTGKIEPVEKVVRIFKSFEEVDAADREYYSSLTPKERLKIAGQLWKRHFGLSPRMARVYRIIKLEES